ncbi:MAG: sigma-70 family RNA polymerase sigma factor [Polyangiaceae bacterium]|nr:sigma-70 family RNA polymerase sigma factor [Polyangiaceae bacterium]
MSDSSALGLLALEDLVEAAVRQDRVAERRLYEQHSGPVHRFALRWVRCREDARDVVQETFTRAFQQLPTLDQPRQFVPWLYGIARNVCLECLKSRRKAHSVGAEATRALAGEAAATPEHELVAREALAVVTRALGGLPEARSEALRLRTQHGLDYREIAGSLGCSVSKAKVEVHRARRTLERALRGVIVLCMALAVASILVGASPAALPEEPPAQPYSTAAPASTPTEDASIPLPSVSVAPPACERGPDRAPGELPWSDAPVTKSIEAP